MNIRDKQCCALVKGRQCKRFSTWAIPTYTRYEPEVGGVKVQSKTVYLCSLHHKKNCKLQEKNLRLPLIEKGFLGSWNKYKYGNLVTCEENIDWETVKELHIPKFWSVVEK